MVAGVQTPATNHFTQVVVSCAPSQDARKYSDGVEFLLSQIRAHPVPDYPHRDRTTLQCSGGDRARSGNVQEAKRGSSWVAASTGDMTTPSLATRTARHRRNGNICCDPAGPARCWARSSGFRHAPSTPLRFVWKILRSERSLPTGSPLTDQLTLLYHQWTGAREWRSPTLSDPVAVTYAIRVLTSVLQPRCASKSDDPVGFTKPVDLRPQRSGLLAFPMQKGFLDLLLSRISGEGNSRECCPFTNANPKMLLKKVIVSKAFGSTFERPGRFPEPSFFSCALRHLQLH